MDKSPLELSIEHWERMRDAETFEDLNEYPGAADCQLCVAYYCVDAEDDDPEHDDYEHPCVDCPVYQRTGKGDCNGTPYLNARTAFNDWRSSGHGVSSSQVRDAWHAAADAEIAFLKSLRAKE